MDKEHLKRLIHHEGFEVDPYVDSKGNITGGVGHLFTAEDYSSFNPEWSIEEKENFWVDKLEEDYSKALSQAVKDTAHFEVPLSSGALEVIAELKFNMGDDGFSPKKWPKMFAALEQGDYNEASRQLVTNSRGGPSQWAKDVKEGRANALSTALRDS